MSYSEIYFNNYFLGDDTDLKNKTLVKYFDINYIPIENLPVAYFSMNNINFIVFINVDFPTPAFPRIRRLDCSDSMISRMSFFIKSKIRILTF